MRGRTAFGLSIAASAAIILSPEVVPDLPRFDSTRASEPPEGHPAVLARGETRAIALEGDSSTTRIPAARIETLPQVVDAAVPGLLEQHHIVGAAIAVVHDDRVLLLRGYGKPRLDSQHDVDPARTVFRIGSVTKIFTAAAALGLAERGLLDLDHDVRDYLPDVPIRYRTTTRQLLTHTAGFDEKLAGGYTESAENLQPLADHVRRYARQIKLPGGAYTYSNTNYAVAGLIVERRSGVSFEDYLARHVFEPLGMSATTAHQPRESDGGIEVARGYRWRGGKYEPLASRFTQSGPAGAVTAPAADMARMMAALLAEGALEGRRVLSPESARSLLSPQFVSHPRIGEAATYGFAVLSARGRRIVYRGGTLGDQASMVLLFPPERLGIFVASTSLPGLGDFLFDPLMTHLVGPAVPMPYPAAPRNGAPHAAHVAGMYRNYHHTRHDLSRLRALMPMIQSVVSPAPDGSIRWQGRRWVEVEPLVFAAAESSDGRQYIVFREDERGRVRELHADGGTFERISWLEQRSFHLALLASSMVVFVSYVLWRLWPVIRDRRSRPPGHGARTCAVVAAALNVAFVGGLVLVIGDLGGTTPLPLPSVVLLCLPLACAAVTVTLPALAATAWIRQWWTARERVAYSAVAAFAVAFLTFLNYWKLLGFRY
jgi:CubicO group peptidase (beta-lactamase class C family)